MSGMVPAHEVIWQFIDLVASLGFITLLFAMMFKLLPDMMIAWRNVWVGSFITALLFTVGKYLLGAYLGRSTLSSAYGAAGSFVVVLLWVYYSAQILLFGAASIRVYAKQHGSPIRPSAHPEFVSPEEASHQWLGFRKGDCADKRIGCLTGIEPGMLHDNPYV
jgi:membrane protein